MAKRYTKKGDLVKAEQNYVKSLENKRKPSTYSEYCKLCFQTNEYAKAKQVILQSLSEFPSNENLNYLAGVVYYNYYNDLDSALFYINKAKIQSKNTEYDFEINIIEQLKQYKQVNISNYSNCSELPNSFIDSLKLDNGFFQLIEDEGFFMCFRGDWWKSWVNINLKEAEFCNSDSILYLKGNIEYCSSDMSSGCQILIAEIIVDIIPIEIKHYKYRYLTHNEEFEISVKISENDYILFLSNDFLDDGWSKAVEIFDIGILLK